MKDPHAPKKPLSGYMMFCNDKRQDLKNDKPELSMTDCAKHLGAMWKALDEEQKKEYKIQAAAEKEKYTELHDEYKKTDNFKNFEKKDKTAKLVRKYALALGFKPKRGSVTFPSDKNSPKKPLSAYMRFSRDKRQEYASEGLSLTELSKKCGAEWKNITDEQKAEYQQAVKDDQEAHQDRLTVYKQSEEYEKYIKEKKAFLKAKKQLYAKLEGKTKTKPKKKRTKKVAKKAVVIQRRKKILSSSEESESEDDSESTDSGEESS